MQEVKNVEGELLRGLLADVVFLDVVAESHDNLVSVALDPIEYALCKDLAHSYYF